MSNEVAVNPVLDVAAPAEGAGGVARGRPAGRGPWSGGRLLAAVLMAAAAVVAMRSAWGDWLMLSRPEFTGVGGDDEHSHVFLVIPFAAAIVYVNRRRLATCSGRPSWVGPALVVAGYALAWMGFNHAYQAFWHFGAVLMALGAVVSVLGHDVLIKFWPAALLLGFMVPMPNYLRLQIAFPLQTVMAAITETVVSLFGENVARQGNLLLINGQPVAIVEACNGLRLVWTLILVSWLFAFVTPLKNWVRWAVILLSPVTALVCNVIRLIPTLLLYGHARHETAEAFHDWAGWGMVVVAFFMLFGVTVLLDKLGIEVRNEEARRATGKEDEGILRVKRPPAT